MLNEYRKDPEQRISEFLQSRVAEYYQEHGEEKRVADLGLPEGTVMLQMSPLDEERLSAQMQSIISSRRGD